MQSALTFSNITADYIDCLPWAFIPPTIPQRSRLNCLEPVGIGTSHVESATSYLARLSASHSVSAGILFCREIVPLVYTQYLSKKGFLSRPGVIMGGRFMELAKSLNGTGSVAGKWIKALESLTLRADLRYLTMLTWSDVLASRHLLRPKQAWCPDCYEEWCINGRRIYQPLLWSLTVVTACTHHRRRLLEYCRHCNRQHNPLTSRAVPGFCPACKQWLGSSNIIISKAHERLTDEEYERQYWLTKNVGEMLAAAPRLADSPAKRSAASSLNHCIVQMTKGCTNAFGAVVNIPRPTLAKWRAGDQAPVLEALLRICFKVDVSPLDFLTGKCFEVGSLNIIESKVSNRDVNQKKEAVKCRRREITPEEAKKITSILKKVLKSDPPRCLKEVAREMGRNPNSIQYRFPDLSAAVIRRYADYEAVVRQELGRQMLYGLKEAANAEYPPRSLAEFARRCSWSLKILRHRFPIQCRALTRRCAEERGKRWLGLKQSLEATLAEEPPPSVDEFARRHNLHTGILYRRFRDLCHKLSERFARHSLRK